MVVAELRIGPLTEEGLDGVMFVCVLGIWCRSRKVERELVNFMCRPCWLGRI